MTIKLYAANPQTWPKGRINAARLDATTESELAAQQASDDEVTMRDAKTRLSETGMETTLTPYENDPDKPLSTPSDAPYSSPSQARLARQQTRLSYSS